MRLGKYISIIFFSLLERFLPFVTPLPASIIHQEPGLTPLRNAPTEGSDFARMAADAAAAVSEQTLVPEKIQALPLAGKQTNLMIAGTVDGQVHALDPDTGDLRWSFSTGEPLVKSYQQLPGTLDEKWWLIPMLDGSMLVKTTHGLRRPGLNARLLVDQAPFLAGSTFFTGSKVSRIFGVNALTGEVRQVLSGDTADSLASDRRLLARSGSDDDVVWIGRTDYTIRAFDVLTGQEQWNLTFGEFVSLDGLKIATGSNGNNGGDSGRKSGIRSATPSHDEAMPSLLASPDGSLRRRASLVRAGKTTPHSNLGDPDEWKAPLPAQVSSVFRVVLEEGSDHAYLPMQPMPLVQSAGDDISTGDAGIAAVGMLGNNQVYAVMLDEEDSMGDVEEPGSASPVGTRAGKKNRPVEGKVPYGGRVTATQPLLPHGDGKRDGGDGNDLGLGGNLDGSGHGISGPLMQCLSPKGCSTKGSLSYAGKKAHGVVAILTLGGRLPIAQ